MEDEEELPYTKSIFSKKWSEFEKDATRLNMNRSQFHDYVYLKWKKNTHRPSLVEITMLLGLALVVVLIMVVK